MLVKSIFFTFCLLLFVSLTMQAQSIISTPQPSPAASLKQKIGLAEVSISYSRPSARGREVFGKLVPFGEAWRTGANSSTTISFDAEMSFEGTLVPAGTYGVYTIPNKESWTVVFNKNTKAGGDMASYKDADDVLRLKVPTEVYAEKLETFTISFSQVTENSARLDFIWEKTKASIVVKQDVHAIVMKQIKTFEENPMRSVANGYFQSANYLFSSESDLPKALDFVNKAIDNKYDAYWVYRTKSLIQAKMKDYKGAIESAKISIEKAQKAEDSHYVRMNEESIREWSK